MFSAREVSASVSCWLPLPICARALSAGRVHRDKMFRPDNQQRFTSGTFLIAGAWNSSEDFCEPMFVSLAGPRARFVIDDLLVMLQQLGGGLSDVILLDAFSGSGGQSFA